MPGIVVCSLDPASAKRGAAMGGRLILPEWSGEKLVYVSPRQTLNKLGYRSLSERGDITPEEIELFAEIEERVPLQDGEVAARRQDIGTPADASARIKSLAGRLGADMVGITPVDPAYVYDGFEVAPGFAVVFAIAMDYEGEILEVPREESNIEYLRVYEALSRLGVQLAGEIRSLGYAARAHTLRDEQLAMLPHAHKAGLGELGKHGSLINRELGCSFRVGVVTTELTLAGDVPRDEGIQDFCRSCQMCVSYCPGGAINDEMEVVRETERWIVDTAKCAPYFAAHYGCAVCLQVCPINAKAFGGEFRDAYVRKMKQLDPLALAEELSATVPAPWAEIEPQEQSP
jgi:epoxyqueuosine reductase